MSTVIKAFEEKYGQEPHSMEELLEWQNALKYFTLGWNASQEDFARMLQWEFDDE